jgi:uncharacterized membrane protein
MEQHEHFFEQHDPDRKEFQIDRIILFSDAVFAIAITLLIIEIKPPEIHEGFGTQQILQQLMNLIPKFVAFIISFFVIAVYWRSHHRIFGFVGGYSNRLIWFNMYFLFTIVLMPFSAAYYSENFAYNIPYTFYNINIIVTGIINYCFIRYVFNPKNNLVNHHPTPLFIHLFKARALTIPIFFFCVILLSPLSFMPTPIIYFLIWPTFYVLRKIIHHKYKNQPAPQTHHRTKHKA